MGRASREGANCGTRADDGRSSAGTRTWPAPNNSGPAAPEAFGPKGANDLFKSLTEGERSRAKDYYDGLQAWAAEVRTSAGNLETVAGRVTEVAREALIKSYLEHLSPSANKDAERFTAEYYFDPINDKFKDLGSALKQWNEAIAAAAEPKPADLEALARKVQERVEACRAIIRRPVSIICTGLR